MEVQRRATDASSAHDDDDDGWRCGRMPPPAPCWTRVHQLFRQACFFRGEAHDARRSLPSSHNSHRRLLCAMWKWRSSMPSYAISRRRPRASLSSSRRTMHVVRTWRSWHRSCTTFALRTHQRHRHRSMRGCGIHCFRSCKCEGTRGQNDGTRFAWGWVSSRWMTMPPSLALWTRVSHGSCPARLGDQPRAVRTLSAAGKRIADASKGVIYFGGSHARSISRICTRAPSTRMSEYRCGQRGCTGETLASDTCK